MVTLKDIRKGSIIIVRGGFGNEAPVKARVDSVQRDIKHGIPGIDYTAITNGDERWAYLEQIERVVMY